MSLRTILIILGILIVAAILIDGFRHWRRARKHQHELDERSEHVASTKAEPWFDKKIDFVDDLDYEPSLKQEDSKLIEPQIKHFDTLEPIDSSEHLDPIDAFESSEVQKPARATSTASAPITMPAPLPKKDKFIILHVLAEPDTYFSGEGLAAKFAAQGLHLGPMNIFHQHQHLNGTGDILFSVANAFEPGTLNLDKGFYTQGLTLFIQLPGEGDTEDAFESMLNTATLLAKAFNARLCDHQRQPLTPVRVQEYRNEVIACNVI